MSYRRAWLLIDSVNRSFAEPATRATVGGAGGGGVTLTGFGTTLVNRYLEVSQRIDSLVRSEFSDLATRSSRQAAQDKKTHLKKTSLKKTIAKRAARRA